MSGLPGGERVLTLKSPNGEELSAPAGVWMLALYDLMPRADKGTLFERVKRMRDEVMAQAGAQNISRPQDLIQLHSPLSPHLMGHSKGDFPSIVSYDRGGKKHIRMYAETGHYFETPGSNKENADK